VGVGETVEKALYAVFSSTDAGKILEISPGAVLLAAKRYEELRDQRVLWSHPGDSPVSVGLLDADWVRERYRQSHRGEVEAAPHLMVLPVIEGLAPVELPIVSDAVEVEVESDLRRRLESLEPLVGAAFEMREKIARLEGDLAEARTETERLRAALRAQILSGRASLEAMGELIPSDPEKSTEV